MSYLRKLENGYVRVTFEIAELIRTSGTPSTAIEFLYIRGVCYYELNANGKIWEDKGVYYEKLDDGYIRVTLKLAELDRTNNSPNANNRPAQIGLLYMGNYNTANGTIRNVICGIGEPELSEKMEKSITLIDAFKNAIHKKIRLWEKALLEQDDNEE